MGDLVEVPPPPMFDELLDAMVEAKGYRVFRHDRLVILHSYDHYGLEEAHERWHGIRDWLHVSVSVQGQLQASMADRAANGGRHRKGGERSPAPLPDWYDLTHVTYNHAAELGFNPLSAVWQYLPPPGEPYLNIAEALHLLQPR